MTRITRRRLLALVAAAPLAALPVGAVAAAAPACDPLYVEAWDVVVDELDALTAGHRLGGDWHRLWPVFFRNVVEEREAAVARHGRAAVEPWARAVDELFRILRAGLDDVKAARVSPVPPERP